MVKGKIQHLMFRQGQTVDLAGSISLSKATLMTLTSNGLRITLTSTKTWFLDVFLNLKSISSSQYRSMPEVNATWLRLPGMTVAIATQGKSLQAEVQLPFWQPLDWHIGILLNSPMGGESQVSLKVANSISLSRKGFLGVFVGMEVDDSLIQHIIEN